MTAETAGAGSTADATELPERWAVWPYRVLITLTAAMFVSQPITAGQFMSGTYGSLELHAIWGYIAAGSAVLFVLPASIVAKWRRAISVRHVVATVALSAIAWIQILLGEGRSLTLHVPLGVAVVMLAILQAWSAWRNQTSRDASL